MNSVAELIAAKRDGRALTREEIRAFLSGSVDGSIPDYQVAAMLMAIFWRGMTGDELATFTEAMIDSGDRLVVDSPRPLVDKHSTGGVGDKISLALAPLVAACGAAVPMMSGRGLGHTGGTLDKLESVPGIRTDFDPDEFGAIVADVGCIIAGQSDRMVPADRVLYALRDTTATVASVPLIASSIMSKKLAEGLDALILDIKVGAGAFMADLAEATDLAQAMYSIGAAHGVAVECFMTRMDDPLGREIGNANELAEAIDVLHGAGPDDVRELVVELGGAMLSAVGLGGGQEIERAIDDGSGAETLAAMLEAQGGDPTCVADPDSLPRAAHSVVIAAPRTGVVTGIDSLELGRAGVDLGAGRTRTGDAVDHGAGITLLARTGAAVAVEQPLAELRAGDESRLGGAARRALTAFTIGDQEPPRQPLVLARYDGAT